MNNKFLVSVITVSLSVYMTAAEPITINPITVNPNPPAGVIPAMRGEQNKAYAPSAVQAKLNVNIKDATQAVHFIRDNSDPFVISKVYLLKNADPFILRGVLKTIVAGSVLDSPVSVESIKYNDGVGALMVSAEEYRFKDAGNGMSIDELVARLDKKNLPNSWGTIDMAYFPKYRPAWELLIMMQESGIGYTGATASAKIHANTDSRATQYNKYGLQINPLAYADYDYSLNAIIMTMPGFDVREALAFLKEIDTPLEEINLTYKLIEVYSENDQKLGLDFQAWKNNDGLDFFSVGGRYGYNNWNGTLNTLAHQNSEYFNFNPKWNTKYLDFLTTSGKAKIVTSGKIALANGYASNLQLTDGIFSVILKPVDNKDYLDMLPIGVLDKKKYKKQMDPKADPPADLPEVLWKALLESYKVQRGNTQYVEAAAEGNVFTLKLSGDVHSKASNLNISMNSTSMIGWDSTGKPRMSTSKYSTNIQIGSNKKEFVIGGITKTSVVRSVSGVPWLKDLPIIGWIFSTETDAVKKSQFVLVATAEVLKPDAQLSKEDKTQADAVIKRVNKYVQSPDSALGFQQLLLDK